jgi:hypothetical protein
VMARAAIAPPTALLTFNTDVAIHCAVGAIECTPD